jgi:hypothetical protein
MTSPMATAVLVGILIGWGTAWLFRVGRINNRQFVAAKRFVLRPLVVSAACFVLCAWLVGTVGYAALDGTTP